VGVLRLLRDPLLTLLVRHAGQHHRHPRSTSTRVDELPPCPAPPRSWTTVIPDPTKRKLASLRDPLIRGPLLAVLLAHTATIAAVSARAARAWG
jgi:hypothetical protein